MTHRNRQRRKARNDESRPQKPLVLVVCEGRRTEPDYFRGFFAHLRNPRIEIEIVEAAGVPKSVVEAAKKRKKESEANAKGENDDNLLFDSVWCVFDVDDHPNIPDALQMADGNGIKVAMSNPCFELWLLLHFRGNPGMQNRECISKVLKSYLPEYDKKVEFKDFADGYENAVKYASGMWREAEEMNEPGRNPTTGVFILTEEVRSSS